MSSPASFNSQTDRSCCKHSIRFDPSDLLCRRRPPTTATGNETVDVKPATVAAGQNEATVKTTVKDAGKEPVAIDYRLEKSADGWKVTDVVVENLSLVTNYRSTFASEVSRSGIDGLIKALDEKNRTVAKS